ncbi:hypothetical protein AV540_25620 [Brevibacillus parabrevis]|uniref:hypothetical protein n=1 Tax=Brevibacillus parabrevis TaxID=54914 RepID=UPI0007ABF978|nr:hypothetical protein [Brevibacillus parabrevis]KZE42399.1 hypothetical protein AV540_25620 [Brevibacillus parabrevis]
MTRWDDIHTIYNAPTFAINNGSIVRVRVDLDKNLDDDEKEFLSSFIDSWTFPKDGKYINPFKVLNFYLNDNFFEVEIKYRKKDKEIDELKLFCQDLMHYLNYYRFHLIKWDCMLLSE